MWLKPQRLWLNSQAPCVMPQRLWLNAHALWVKAQPLWLDAQALWLHAQRLWLDAQALRVKGTGQDIAYRSLRVAIGLAADVRPLIDSRDVTDQGRSETI